MEHKFDIVVATSLPHHVTNLEAIGERNRIPWKCPADLRHFRNITSMTADPTKQNAVVMGRRTWLSLDELNIAPLPTRLNCVISSVSELEGADAIYKSLDDALTALYKNKGVESVFVIGGGKLYAEAINHDDVSMIIKTIIHVPCPRYADVFFPSIPSSFILSYQTALHKCERPRSPSFHIEYWQHQQTSLEHE